jgi:hypothetical protein
MVASIAGGMQAAALTAGWGLDAEDVWVVHKEGSGEKSKLLFARAKRVKDEDGGKMRVDIYPNQGCPSGERVFEESEIHPVSKESVAEDLIDLETVNEGTVLEWYAPVSNSRTEHTAHTLFFLKCSRAP